MIVLLFDSYAYSSSYNSTNELDHIVVSDVDIVVHLRILYGHVFMTIFQIRLILRFQWEQILIL